jgi:hypothetical protein
MTDKKEMKFIKLLDTSTLNNLKSNLKKTNLNQIKQAKNMLKCLNAKGNLNYILLISKILYLNKINSIFQLI